MKFKDIINEEKKELSGISIAKKIMPKGTIFDRKRASWDKRGGYAGERTLKIIADKAEKFGLTSSEYKPTGNADGSFVGNNVFFKSKDGNTTLRLIKSYGITASKNDFSAEMRYKEED